MDNYIKISEHSYLIKNQSSFNKALYNYFGLDKEENNESNYTKKEIRKMVQTYPTVYPCLIIIVNQTFECNRIYTECIPINKLSIEIQNFTK